MAASAAARRFPGRGRTRGDDAAYVDGAAAADFYGPRLFSHLLLAVVAVFFVVFIVWANWATLDEVTRGEGRVIPSGQVQVVQNLEGGIVRQLLVRDGDTVDPGQVLMRIDNIRAATEFREARSRYLSNLAAIARLRAEIDETAVEFPPEVVADARLMAESELALFNARQDDLQSQIEILERQVEQREQELAELRVKADQYARSHALAVEQLNITEPLAKQRIVARSEMLGLQRQVNDLKGELDQAQLEIPRAEAAVREANKRIEQAYTNFRAGSLRELSQLQSEIASIREIITAGEDRVSRTEVRSPVHGIVKRVLENTIGGVVEPGEDLVEIVPLDDSLLVEAEVRPADIAFLYPGLPATVKITAYDFAIYGGLDGTVESISADTIVNERGESFYHVRVRTERNSLGTESNPLSIIPGMTAQVDVLTGKKTVLDYLLKPILRARERAMRER